MPRSIADALTREVPLLSFDEPVIGAARRIVAAGLPALPVVDAHGVLCGIFGEREFIAALFPGYLGQLRYAAFVPHSLDPELTRGARTLTDHVAAHVNAEHVDVPREHSDAQLAETFLHHRVLIVPVVDERRHVLGIVTRSDFFTALAARIEGG